MRIRRRPQAQQQQSQSLPPYSLLPGQPPSDPFAAPHPPPNAEGRRPGDDAAQGKTRIKPPGELHPRRADADPPAAAADPAATRPALPPPPQGGNVVAAVGRSSGDGDGGHGHGGGAGAQRQGAPAAAQGHTHARANTHESLENGHCNVPERPVVGAGERLVIPAMPVVPVNVKEGVKIGGGGAKKRGRGPPVLMEGSRCSRVNGRGWRCSQPTLVGYSLCEHHLGKGRGQRSASRTEPSSWTNGAATLGRTEPSIRKKAVQPSVPVVAAAPTANGRTGAPKLGRTEPASSRKNIDALAMVAAASDLPNLRAGPLAAEVD